MTLGACSLQPYVPAPLNETRVPDEIASGRLDTPAQLAILARAEIPHAPGSPWTPTQLALLAVARNRGLAAARSAVTAALARSRLARLRQNPQVNLTLEHHSKRDDKDDSRWSIGPSLELSLVPPEIRRLSGERADLDVARARLDAIETAWQARSTARAAALALLAWTEESDPVRTSLELRDEIVAAARALTAAGATDAFEWQSVILERNAARLAQLSRTTAGAAARASLAAALNVPNAVFDALALAAEEPVPIPDYETLRARMLQSHPVVLRAIAAHAQAERDLALAVAAQYPTLQLNPGYFFDQGDHVWSLLGGIVVPLFARHEVAIDSAAAARDAARDAVYAAQAEAIADLQRAHSAWRAATTVVADVRAVRAEIVAAHAELRSQRQAEIVDDLAVARAALQVAEADLRLLAACADERRTREALLASSRVVELDPPFARVFDELVVAESGAGALAR